MARFVLIHSPVVGPYTWQLVAARLAGLGHEVTVPSLLAVGDFGPPFWPHVVSAVTAALAGVDPDQPLVLVAHSNAGNFVSVVRRALAQPVLCSVFADATVPGRRGTAATAGEGFQEFLRGMAEPDGRLPKWTDWWPGEDLTPLFPDARTRELVAGELPRLPLAYYAEQVPVPAGWDDHPCAYLHFSAGYDGEAQKAAARGWPVRDLPGEHLHQLVDPAGVATVVADFATRAGGFETGLNTARRAGPGRWPGRAR